MAIRNMTKYEVEDHENGVFTIITDQPGLALSRFLKERPDHVILSTYGYPGPMPGLVYGGEKKIHEIVVVSDWPHDRQC